MVANVFRAPAHSVRALGVVTSEVLPGGGNAGCSPTREQGLETEGLLCCSLGIITNLKVEKMRINFQRDKSNIS